MIYDRVGTPGSLKVAAVVSRHKYQQGGPHHPSPHCKIVVPSGMFPALSAGTYRECRLGGKASCQPSRQDSCRRAICHLKCAELAAFTRKAVVAVLADVMTTIVYGRTGPGPGRPSETWSAAAWEPSTCLFKRHGTHIWLLRGPLVGQVQQQRNQCSPRGGPAPRRPLAAVALSTTELQSILTALP